MSEVAWGIEDFWPLRSDVNQLSEEAVQRVQSQAKQAKQIAQQIKQDKAINYHLAQFLAFLLKEIQNEELIKAITDTFFKTTNPKDQITYLRKDINTYVVVWFFLPFFQKEAAQAKILPLYAKLGYQEANQSLKNYVTDLKRLSEQYHDKVPIDQNTLLTLIVIIVKERLNPWKNIDSQPLKKEILQLL